MIVVVLALGWGSQGQTLLTINPSEKLIYVKIVDGIKTFVVINGDNYEEYTLQSGECGSLSDDGRYIALSSEQPTTLRIVHFESQRIVFETPWVSEWIPCLIRWESNNILILITSGSNHNIRNDFKFENLVLNPDVIYPEPTYPTLPYFTPIFEPNGTRMFYLQNPANPSIYFYEQCYAEKHLGVECGDVETVIYDLTMNMELEVIDTDTTYIRGFRIDMQGNIRGGYSLVSWSTNGRYLAYFSPLYDDPYIPDEGEIIIYDLQMDRYIDNNASLYLPNIHQRFQWANNNVLLVWKTGRFLEGSQYHDTLAQFTFFYPDTETYVDSINILNVLSPRATFSPDGRSMSVVGKIVEGIDAPVFDENPTRADLILISTTTGESTVIDTNVTEIITWRTVIDGE